MAVAKPQGAGQPGANPHAIGRHAGFDRLQAMSGLDRWLAGAVALLALAALTLALRPDATVFLKPFSEDGYYSLAVARNLAAGHGMTIDGVTLTNGIQPLLTFLQAGLFWLAGGNDLVALRLVLLLYWLLYLGTGALLGRIAAEALPDAPGRRTRALATALLYLGASYLFLHHFNGLETGLLLFLLAAAWRYQQAGAAESWAGLALFGALLGLAVLARIDAGFVVVCLAAAELWRWRRRSLARGLARGALLGLIALLVSSPWWAYNILVFGSPMPISGTATQAWALDGFRLAWALWGLAMGGFPWLFGGEAEGLALDLIRLPLYGLGLWILWRVYRRLPPATRDFALALGAAVILLGLYYWLSSIAYWFYSRYLAPAALPVALGLGLALAGLLQRRARALAWIAPLLLLPVIGLAVLAWSGKGVYGTIMFWDQVLLVRASVPEGDTIAAGQSGTLNFFRPHVVNMDGKVNPEVFAYRGHLWDYLARRDIRWFVDWPVYVQRVLGDDPAVHGWRLVGRRANFLLYRRDGP
jgi:4-amino-4-deoxy-L-arabinose transferase-like glycosyltransferase